MFPLAFLDFLKIGSTQLLKGDERPWFNRWDGWQLSCSCG